MLQITEIKNGLLSVVQSKTEQNPVERLLSSLDIDFTSVEQIELSDLKAKDQISNFELIFFDIRDTSPSQIDTFTELNRNYPDTPKLLVCDEKTEKHAISLLKLGAENYILVEGLNQQLLIQFIRCVLIQNQTEHKLDHYQHIMNQMEVGYVPSGIVGVPERQPDRHEISEFLSNVSHDFKSPIHGILSFASFGIKKIHQVSEDKILDYLTKISECGNRLLYLVDDLFDLSKLESGVIQFNFSKSPFSEMILVALNEIRSRAKEKEITFHFHHPDFDDMVEFDPHWIIKVILNLFSNAIRFSNRGSKVEVRLDNFKGHVQLAIIDQGIGIAKENLKGVFNKHFNCKKSKAGSESTGLGLAICKQIIHYHNGTIWAEQNSQEGVRFIFRIPKKKSKLSPNIAILNPKTDLRVDYSVKAN